MRRPPAPAQLAATRPQAPFLDKRCGATRNARARPAAAVGPLKGYVTELRMIEAEEDPPGPESAPQEQLPMVVPSDG